MGQYPIVILSNKIPVGFFVLHTTERVQEYSSNPQAMLLTALSMDHKQQGKGYAKKQCFYWLTLSSMNLKNLTK